MGSAVLLLLALKMGIASSMGVLFGWQPMPDGSPKVEYIVQIEPELAATLQEGQSIPITSDIPDDIGPIGRIRIVVGRDELPRQKLVTRFKPWPVKQPRQGLAETQHTVPPVQPSVGGRYGTQAASNNSILPPSVNGAAIANPFGKTLQQGAQQAKNLAADLKQQILPPTGNELFSESGVGQGVRNAIDNTANQLRQGLQQGVQQGVQQVADRTGQQLRKAVDNVGQGARNAIDKFGRADATGRSILNDGQGQSTATILPPSSPPVGLASKGRRIDQPIQPLQPQRQQPRGSTPPANFAAGTNPSSQPGVFNAPWPPTTGSPPADTRVSNPLPNRYGNQEVPRPPLQTTGWPREKSSRNEYDLASRQEDYRTPQSHGNHQHSENSRPDFNMAGAGMEGPRLPKMNTQPTSQQQDEASWSTRPPTVEIRADMLDQPAGGNMQTTTNTQGYQQQTTNRQSYDAQNRDYSRNSNHSNLEDPHNPGPKNETLFPLLLSWVLLSGSGAGNAYLWWSYLDVRNKYRGVVHGSPRRHERYDD